MTRAKRTTAILVDDAMAHMQEFMELVGTGITEINAALEVGWTIKDLNNYLQDPEVRDMIDAARAYADGRVEKILYDKALDGNMTAITMWLHNRQPGRWKDVRRIEVSGSTTVAVDVSSVKEAALAMLAQVGPAATQALPAYIETTAREAVDADEVED